MTTAETSPSEVQTEGHAHAHPSYVRIWAILCGLLIVSMLGPLWGVRIVTLVTAFGVAGLKAYLVAKHFLRIGSERRFVAYALVTAVAFMVLLFAGTAPDVLEHHGRSWTNVAAKREVERALSEPASGSDPGEH
jgi:caa(3)-type oxidase subunit IV